MDDPNPNAPGPATLEQLYEFQLRVLDASYGHAKSYFNLVIVGGYASYFGLWKLTEDLLSDDQRRWSGILLALSVLSFVIWEISQMILRTKSIQKFNNSMKNFEDFPRLIAEYEASEQATQRWLIPIWIAQLVFTVSTALVGAGVLMWAFVKPLICGC